MCLKAASFSISAAATGGIPQRPVWNNNSATRRPPRRSPATREGNIPEIHVLKEHVQAEGSRGEQEEARNGGRRDGCGHHAGGSARSIAAEPGRGKDENALRRE